MYSGASEPAPLDPTAAARPSSGSSPRVRWLLIVLLGLAFVAAGGPRRVLSQVGYELECGRLQATSDRLADLDAVSNAFRLVANVARPGVVQIVASSRREEEFAELQARREQIREQLDDIDARLEQGGLPESESMALLRQERALRFERGRIEAFLERRREGTGSGIILDEDGHILTNNHVATAGDELRVRLSDGRAYEGAVVGADAQSDLAVVRIQASGLHPLAFGDSDAMQVGDWVLAVGAPFGLDQTVTHGIVSAKGRSDIDIGHGIVFQDFIQTDASINPGNSGGPLLNLRGEVIGINTAIATASEGYNAGVAFTIPSNMALKIAQQLKRGGEVARGWLGITMADLTNEDRELFKVEAGAGVLVDNVIEGDPAEQGGVRVEDVIVAVNGRAVANLGQLRGLIADIAPGETATLRVVRAAEPLELKITFGRRPSALPGRLLGDEEQPVFLPGLTAGVRTLRPSRARLVEREATDRGVRVVEAPSSARDRFRPDDLILEVNGERVATVADLRRALEAAAGRAEIECQVEDLKGERRTVRILAGP
jgi:Do/DeqQ family serine protease